MRKPENIPHLFYQIIEILKNTAKYDSINIELYRLDILIFLSKTSEYYHHIQLLIKQSLSSTKSSKNCNHLFIQTDRVELLINLLKLPPKIHTDILNFVEDELKKEKATDYMLSSAREELARVYGDLKSKK